MSYLKKKDIFRNNLTMLVTQSDKTATDIARDIGIHPNTFYDWLRGNTYARPDKMELLEKYFKVNSGYLEKDHLKEESGQISTKLNDYDMKIVNYLLNADADTRYLIDCISKSSNNEKKFLHYYFNVDEISKKTIEEFAEYLVNKNRAN